MTGTLALVGGAEWTEGCTFDRGLLEASGGSTVTVLPTAAAYENPARVFESATSWFTGLGASTEMLPVTTRAHASDAGLAAKAAAARFLYLPSGSSMHLRSVLKDTPLLGALVTAWRSGAVVAASAESAAVLCTHMVDNRGGAFTVGVGLLDSLTVVPRADTWSEDKWHRTVRLAAPDLAVVGIDERTALISGPDGWRAEGAGGVTVWLGGHRLGVADLAPLVIGAA